MDLDIKQLFEDQKSKNVEGLRDAMDQILNGSTQSSGELNLMIEKMIREKSEEKELEKEKSIQLQDLIRNLEKGSNNDSRIAERALVLLSDQLKAQQKMIEKLMEMLMELKVPESSDLDIASLQGILKSLIGGEEIK